MQGGVKAEWTCSMCTLINPAQVTLCEACGSFKTEPFKPEDLVEAQWGGGTRWYPGKILGVNNGLFHVAYDDGTFESAVKPEHIRLKSVEPDPLRLRSEVDALKTPPTKTEYHKGYNSKSRHRNRQPGEDPSAKVDALKSPTTKTEYHKGYNDESRLRNRPPRNAPSAKVDALKTPTKKTEYYKGYNDESPLRSRQSGDAPSVKEFCVDYHPSGLSFNSQAYHSPLHQPSSIGLASLSLKDGDAQHRPDTVHEQLNLKHSPSRSKTDVVLENIQDQERDAQQRRDTVCKQLDLKYSPSGSTADLAPDNLHCQAFQSQQFPPPPQSDDVFNLNETDCPACGAACTTRESFLRHLNSTKKNCKNYAPPKPPFNIICSSCGATFWNEDAMVKHLRTNLQCVKNLSNEKDCPACGEVCPSKDQLLLHWNSKMNKCNSVSPPKPPSNIICRSCEAGFWYQDALIKHLSTNHECARNISTRVPECDRHRSPEYSPEEKCKPRSTSANTGPRRSASANTGWKSNPEKVKDPRYNQPTKSVLSAFLSKHLLLDFKSYLESNFGVRVISDFKSLGKDSWAQIEHTMKEANYTRLRNGLADENILPLSLCNRDPYTVGGNEKAEIISSSDHQEPAVGSQAIVDLVQLPRGKRYHCFASHKKSTGSDRVAMHIADVLRHKYKLEAFFDKDNLRGKKINDEQLALSVKESCVLIAILDDSVLESSFCLQEWESAHLHKVPIVAVFDIDIYNNTKRGEIIEKINKAGFGYVTEWRIVEYNATYRDPAIRDLAEIITEACRNQKIL